MTLFEKINTTEPGRLARGLGAVAYDHGGKLGKDAVDAISKAQAYLEKLAIEELRKAIEPWVQELQKRMADGSL